MRWLVAGGHGMLGRDAVGRLTSAGHSVLAPARVDLDITDPDACRHAARSVDVILNCAGWTAVDDAEDAEEGAFAVNALGAANLARAARSAGAQIVHISTDYVFDGRVHTPYDEDTPLSPCSAYGRTKGAGEWAVRAEHPGAIVVRTAWLYGQHGRCFPKTIAARAAGTGWLEVVDDQWGQPTWTVDVADVVIRLVEAAAPAGIYHATASGSTNWCTFAKEVLEAARHTAVRLRAVSSDRYPARARRPHYSVLSHGALLRHGIAPIGEWRRRWRSAAERVLT